MFGINKAEATETEAVATPEVVELPVELLPLVAGYAIPIALPATTEGSWLKMPIGAMAELNELASQSVYYNHVTGAYDKLDDAMIADLMKQLNDHPAMVAVYKKAAEREDKRRGKSVLNRKER